jgi:hypothetical protein
VLIQEVAAVRRFVVVVAAGLLITIVGAPTAGAATYSVWSCANGAGKPLPAGDWSASTGGRAVVTTTTCGAASAGGTAGNLQAVAGGGPGQADVGVYAEWATTAAPGTQISAFDVWWTNQSHIQTDGRIQIYAGPTSLYSRDGDGFGNPALPYDADNHQVFSGLSADSISLVAWCLVPCAQPNPTVSALFQAYRTKLTVNDPTAPTGDASGVTDGMTIGAPVNVLARASDVGGGVRDLQLVIDQKVVDTRRAGGQCDDIDPTTGDANDYAVVRPCAAQLPAASLPPAQFTLTPALLGTGTQHVVEVLAHDAAGNVGTLLKRQVVVAPALFDGSATPNFYDPARDLFFNPDADTTGPSRPNGSNAGPANVALAFAVRGHTRKGGKRHVVTRLSARRTRSYTAPTRVVGSVKTPDGQPIALARVYLATAVAGGPWALGGLPLISDQGGNVSVVLPARNPSRRVRLVYFPQSASNDSFRSPVIALRVRVPVALALSKRAVPRGTRVNITARVRAGMNPGSTVISALQLKVGKHWRTIRQLRFTPRSRGVTHTALRLRTPSVYRLRLRVSAQPGLSYTTGASPTRALLVR